MSTRRILLDDPHLPLFLRERLATCGKPIGARWGYCRQVACDRCRHHRARQWADEAVQEFGQCATARLRRLDITVGSVVRTTEIVRLMCRARKRLRNVVARLRRANGNAAALSAIGGFVIDRHHGRWSVSLRALLDLGRLHELRIGDMIERIWHGRDRAHLDEVAMHDVPVIITSILDFSAIAQWENGAAVELFSLFATRGNHAALRFRLRRSRIARSDAFAAIAAATIGPLAEDRR